MPLAGDYAEAVRLFSQVAAAQPQDTAVKLLLASAQKQAGQLREARHTYDTILKTASDPEDLEAARRGLEELLQVAPELAEAPLYRRRTSFSLGRGLLLNWRSRILFPSLLLRRGEKLGPIPLLRRATALENLPNLSRRDSQWSQQPCWAPLSPCPRLLEQREGV